MNPTWQNFLRSAQAGFPSPTGISFPARPAEHQRIFALAHLGVLTVSGNDAATLLQGQITCNIKDITDEQSSLGAVCNPKGRAIATFLLVKQADVFHLVLPIGLLETVKKRLGMFILRSIVTITDNTNAYCLLGITAPPAPSPGAWLATTRQTFISVHWGARDLILATPDEAIAFWSEQVKQGFQPDNPANWQLLDIESGIPWLNAETSEEFVPQMLNLDKLGGISFTKGCYTGQEIIARTHYLGKSKRGMLLAEAGKPAPEPNTNVLDGRDETVGQVLAAQTDGPNCKLLIVTQLAEDKQYQLKLADGRPLHIIPTTEYGQER
ncbi:MAG: folate-binding protein [Methylovulum miyakonense]|uniref:CAF17-like 4Fe-4S cluster assembly/insertion protein YgfZ n=1 Tax=Methylovulum miyakonense TaxID=645578 RepID=UPI003BB62CF0